MKHTLLAILTYAAAILQSAACFRMAGDAPTMLFLPLVLALAVFVCEGWLAIVWAAVIGFTSDCLRAGPMGVDMVCAVLVAAMSLHLHPERHRYGRFRQLFWGTTWCAAFVLLSTALDVAVAKQTVAAMPLLRYTVVQTGQMIATATVGFLVWNMIAPLLPRTWRERRQTAV